MVKVVTLTPQELHQRRLAAGLRQQDLAGVAGVPQSTLSRFERGDGPLGPKNQQRLLIALAFFERTGGEATLPPLPPRSPTACAPSPCPPGQPPDAGSPLEPAGTAFLASV
jgi:transcriptional regulator with XRE-family HTH domain